MPNSFLVEPHRIKKNKKEAFSLLELSMVLLIISLLVSGVVAGNSIVGMSKLSAARSATLSSQIISIPGMVLWLESSSRNSFGQTQFTQGNQIETWYNLEPSNFLEKNNLATTLSDDSIFEETGINDIPTVKMTIDGGMSLEEFSQGSLISNTIAIVFQPISISGTASTILDSGSASQPTVSIGIKESGVELNAGTPISSSVLINAASFIAGQDYILLVNFNGSDSKVFVNNLTEVGGDELTEGTLNPGQNALTGITLGEDNTETSGIEAKISEVIIYNRVLKDSEMKNVMHYLSKKYKIELEAN